MLRGAPSPLFFAVGSSVWDRCESRRRSDDWLNEQRKAYRAQVAIIDSGKFLLAASSPGDSKNASVWWSRSSSAVPEEAFDSAFFLALDGEGVPYFACPRSTLTVAPDAGKTGPIFADARKTLLQMPSEEATRAAHAFGSVMWHESARHCGYCGRPTVSQHGGSSRKCGDPRCGKPVYPRVNPVVIMAVESSDGSKLLLGQGKQRPIERMYSVLAGFVEQSESLDDAVAREVMEEVGLPVGQVSFFDSQPWPFPGNLMLGCFCRALHDEINVDYEELDDARWFTAAEIEAALHLDPALRSGGDAMILPSSQAIAHHLISEWLARQKQNLNNASCKL